MERLYIEKRLVIEIASEKEPRIGSQLYHLNVSSFDSNLVLIAIWSLMWSTNSVVVHAIPPLSNKRVDIWPREFLSIKIPIRRWDNM